MNEQRANEILHGVALNVYFSSLPNDKLYDFLCERLQAQFDLEADSETNAILEEIAARLPEPVEAGEKIRQAAQAIHVAILEHYCSRSKDAPKREEIDTLIADVLLRHFPAVEGEGRADKNPACAECGGDHPFDTVLSSPLWNEIIRGNDLADYLCLLCIVKAFVKANRMFSAQLFGDDVSDTVIEVRPPSTESNHDACIAQIEFTLNQRSEIQHELEAAKAEVARLTDEIQQPRCIQCDAVLGDNWCGRCAGQAAQQELGKLRSALERLTQERDKWRKRALAFRSAYRDKLVTVQALQIQKWQLEAKGADVILPWQNRALRTSLLEACTERNEARSLLSSLRAREQEARGVIEGLISIAGTDGPWCLDCQNDPQYGHGASCSVTQARAWLNPVVEVKGE